MNGLASKGDRNFGTRQVVQALRLGRRRRTAQAANFVVVCQRPQLDAVGLGACRQRLGGQGAVRDNRMAVQVGVENVFWAHRVILGFMPSSAGAMDPNPQTGL